MSPALDTTPPPIGYIDGAHPRPVGPVRVKYPFNTARQKPDQQPDPYPREITRTYKDHNSTYRPRLHERTSWTNLLTYSSTLANAAWTKTNLTATDSVAAHPRDGLATLSTLIETVTNAAHTLGRAHTFTVATEHTLSIIAKAKGRDWLRLHSNDGTQDFAAWYNLATGAVVPEPPTAIITASKLNGGFETPGGGGQPFASWTKAETATSTVTRDTVDYDTGSASCKFTIDGLGSLVQVNQPVLNIGSRYQLSIRAKNNGGSGAILVPDFIGGNYGTTSALSAVWSTHTFTFTAVSSQFGFAANAATEAFWVDSVELTPLDLPVATITLLPFPAVAAYRCALTFLPRAAVGTIAAGLSSDGSTLSYAGSTSLGVYAGSLELKAASTAGPVVETLGSARTVLSPDLDPDDCFAYLLAESDAEPAGIGDLCRVTRTFARVPAQQLTRDYQSFARPDFSGLKSGSVYAASLDGGKSVHLWSSRKLVTATVNTTGTTQTNNLPSGTVTVTTTTGASCTFAANATKATIDAALATLIGSSPSGLAYFNSFVSASVVSFTWGRWAGGPNIASVVGPSGTDVVLLGNPPSQAKITGVGTIIVPDTKLITCIGHNGGVGLGCGVWNGDSFMALGSVAGVTDADHLALVLSDLSSPDFNITHLSFADAATVRYAIGETKINILTARDFFLRGITMLADGTTLADLDSLLPVTTYRPPQRWLDRLVAGDTLTAIEASQLGTQLGALQWRDTVFAKKDATCLESLSLT